MNIRDSIAFVSGTSRGIGRAYVTRLLERGAAKVYAAARDTTAIADLVADGGGRVVPVALDITDHATVAAAAEEASDTTLLINNAGYNNNSPLLGVGDLGPARQEMETNYFGTLAMCRAFAPVLKANGGGAMINMLSILSRVNLPMMGSLCASKAAELSLTQGVRAELAAQGTAVVAVMPGAVDTDMTAGVDIPKMQPVEVVSAALDALEAGIEDVYPGDMATGVAQGLAAEPKAVEKEFAGYLPQ